MYPLIASRKHTHKKNKFKKQLDIIPILTKETCKNLILKKQLEINKLKEIIKIKEYEIQILKILK